MDIKDIINSYGFNDYYEMSTGRTFLLSKTGYDPEKNISTIPVSQDGDIIGNIQIPGNIREDSVS